MKTYILPGNFERKIEFFSFCRNHATKQWVDELGLNDFARRETSASYTQILEMAKVDTKAVWSCNPRKIFRVSDYWDIGVTTFDTKNRVRYHVWIHVPAEILTDEIFKKFGITTKNF